MKDNNLIKTIIPQKGTMRASLKTKNSYVEFGDHPVAQSIQDLGISKKPFMQSYYVERAGILPSGTVVEENVKSFDGYKGSTRKAKHTVVYKRDA